MRYASGSTSWSVRGFVRSLAARWRHRHLVALAPSTCAVLRVPGTDAVVLRFACPPFKRQVALVVSKELLLHTADAAMTALGLADEVEASKN